MLSCHHSGVISYATYGNQMLHSSTVTVRSTTLLQLLLLLLLLLSLAWYGVPECADAHSISRRRSLSCPFPPPPPRPVAPTKASNCLTETNSPGHRLLNPDFCVGSDRPLPKHLLDWTVFYVILPSDTSLRVTGAAIKGQTWFCKLNSPPRRQIFPVICGTIRKFQV